MDDPKKTSRLNADDPLIKEALERIRARGDTGGSARIGKAHEVTLKIGDISTTVEMRDDMSYLLGRFSQAAPKRNSIDLDPYDAFQHGVSRIHAQIHMNDGLLYVTDMDSTNGTYLDERKLVAHHNYKLPSGSTLVLGRLHIDIVFEEEAE